MFSKIIFVSCILAGLISVIFTSPMVNNIAATLPFPGQQNDAISTLPFPPNPELESMGFSDASINSMREEFLQLLASMREEKSVDMESLMPDLSASPNTRNFQNLFNLSAALAGRPNNTAALTFIPLITLLFG